MQTFGIGWVILHISMLYTHIVLIFMYDELHEYNLEGTC